MRSGTWRSRFRKHAVRSLQPQRPTINVHLRLLKNWTPHWHLLQPARRDHVLTHNDPPLLAGLRTDWPLAKPIFGLTQTLRGRTLDSRDAKQVARYPILSAASATAMISIPSCFLRPRLRLRDHARAAKPVVTSPIPLCSEMPQLHEERAKHRNSAGRSASRRRTLSRRLPFGSNN